MHTHGIILVFEDGRHAVVRYHNGDTNGNIQYCNTAWDYVAATSVFGDSANLNQWGENNVHPLTNEERAAITTGDGLDLTVVVADGQQGVHSQPPMPKGKKIRSSIQCSPLFSGRFARYHVYAPARRVCAPAPPRPLRGKRGRKKPQKGRGKP